MGANFGHYHCTRAGQGGGGRRDAAPSKISRPAAAGLARIGPAKSATAANLGRRIFMFSGHLSLTNTSFPPFLEPPNSFPWSLFEYSSPFESYDENKVGRRLDGVFRLPQQLLNQGNGTDEFLVSWAFH